MDPSIAEAVSSILWVAPQLFTDVAEMKVISEQLTLKYGKKYTEVSNLHCNVKLLFFLVKLLKIFQVIVKI